MKKTDDSMIAEDLEDAEILLMENRLNHCIKLNNTLSDEVKALSDSEFKLKGEVEVLKDLVKGFVDENKQLNLALRLKCVAPWVMSAVFAIGFIIVVVRG